MSTSKTIEQLVADAIDTCVEAEQVRWQRRVEDTLRRLGIEPFDASGNESGDLLDWTDDQVRHAVLELQEQIDELKTAVRRAGSKS